jgi:hypothetical protein
MAADARQAPGESSVSDSSAKTAPAPAQIIHRTRERARLRVAGRRRDLPYFLALYEDLRARPGIDEVSINPLTGSVLLGFRAEQGGRLHELLADSELLRLVPESATADMVGHPHAFHSSLNNMRILVFVIMLALSIQQLLKGQLVVPILTILLYVVDLAAGLRLEREAALQSHPEHQEAG